MSVHAFMALRVPEMELSDAEALMLAKSLKRVEKYYPRVMAVFSDRVTDHLALLSALGQVYGQRIAAVAIRVRAEQNGPATEGTVIDMTGRFSGPNKPN